MTNSEESCISRDGEDERAAQAEEWADLRHWAVIAMWLAGLSLVPTSVTVYGALETAMHGANGAISTGLTTAAIGGTMTAFAGGCSTLLSETPESARRRCKIAAAGFLATAGSMCGVIFQVTITVLHATAAG